MAKKVIDILKESSNSDIIEKANKFLESLVKFKEELDDFNKNNVGFTITTQARIDPLMKSLAESLDYLVKCLGGELESDDLRIFTEATKVANGKVLMATVGMITVMASDNGRYLLSKDSKDGWKPYSHMEGLTKKDLADVVKAVSEFLDAIRRKES